jgi:hypothetical protein
MQWAYWHNFFFFEASSLLTVCDEGTVFSKEPVLRISIACVRNRVNGSYEFNGENAFAVDAVCGTCR